MLSKTKKRISKFKTKTVRFHYFGKYIKISIGYFTAICVHLKNFIILIIFSYQSSYQGIVLYQEVFF